MLKKNTSLLALVVVLVLPAIAWAGPILGPNNEQVKEQEVNVAYQTVANAIHVLTAFKQHGIADAIIGYSVSNWSLKWKIYGLAQTRNIPTCLVKSDKLDAFDWVKVIQQTHIHCADSLLKRVFKREDVIKLAEKIGSIYIHTEIKGKDDADEDVRHKAANKVKQYTDEALASLHKLLRTAPPKGSTLSLKPTTLPMSIVKLYAEGGFDVPPSPIKDGVKSASTDKGSEDKSVRPSDVKTDEEKLSLIGTDAPGVVAPTSPVSNEEEGKPVKEAKVEDGKPEKPAEQTKGSEETKETKPADKGQTEVNSEKEKQLIAYIVSLKNKVDMLEKQLQQQYQKGPQRIPVYVVVPNRTSTSQRSNADLQRMHSDLRDRLTQLQQQRQRPPVVVSNYYTRRNYCHQQTMMYLQAVMTFIQAQRSMRSRRRG